MNVFIPENPKVRVYVDSEGNPVGQLNNILPTFEVEVITLPMGSMVNDIEAKLPDSLPFAGVFEDNNVQLIKV